MSWISALLPNASIKDSLEEISSDGQIMISDIIQLAKEFEVSTEAILWRLVNLRILKKTQVEDITSSPELREMDKSLRQGLYFKTRPELFPPRYVYLAYKALSEGRISRGVFAEYLTIDRSEVDEYLKGQGFLEHDYEKVASA